MVTVRSGGHSPVGERPRIWTESVRLGTRARGLVEGVTCIRCLIFAIDDGLSIFDLYVMYVLF